MLILVLADRHGNLTLRSLVGTLLKICKSFGTWEAQCLTMPNRVRFSDTSSTAQGGGGSFKNRKPIGDVGCCESGMAERSH